MFRRRFLIALLGLVLGLLQARLSVDMVRLADRPESFAQWPMSVKGSTLGLSGLEPEALAAGLAEDDRLLAIEGRPVRGTLDIMAPLGKRAPGDRLEVTVERNGARVEARVPLAAFKSGARATQRSVMLVVGMVNAWVCLALAFFVVWARPESRLAWSLLALLAGFAHVISDDLALTARWGSPMAELAAVTSFLGSALWPLGMMWFGYDFPDPAHPLRWLPRLRWPVTLALLAAALVPAAAYVWQQHDAVAAAPLMALLTHATRVGTVAGFAAIGMFFGNLGYKASVEKAADARRRLRLLYYGALVTLTPMGLVVVAAVVLARGDFAAWPVWIWGPPVTLSMLFPFVLAYLILVDRALDVGVVVRQGLQYALATRGVAILRGVVIGGAIFYAVRLQSGAEFNTPQRILVLSVMVIVILGARKAAERLRAFVDRRFFGEQVEAEQMLAQLSREVRSITSTPALMDLVSRRIIEALHVEWARVALDGAPAGEAVELALPLEGTRGQLGTLLLGPKKNEEPYSRSDRGLLETVAAQTAMAIENSRLLAQVEAETAQRERYRRELEIARDVQQRLFPAGRVAVEGLDAAGHCRPAEEVGGDYYDFFPLEGGGFACALGDVSGKGVPASLVMASLQSSLRGLQMGGVQSPARLLESLNVLIHASTARSRFATLTYVEFDACRRRLRYASAGHPPALLIRAGGELEWLTGRSLALGLMRSVRYEEGEAPLGPDDLVLLYSDGFSEAMNEAREQWGEQRLAEAAQRLKGRPAEEVMQGLFAEATAWAGGAPQHDDMTLIVVRVGSAKASSV